jgi:hypothetical protein
MVEEAIMIYLIAALFLLAGLAMGLGVGMRIGRAQTAREYDDVLERIEPSPRTPGQPTNLGEPFSRVTNTRWRRRMMTGDAQDE